MEYLCVLIKPSSDKCNMNCKYCFYADISQYREKGNGFMSVETAENLIVKSFDEATSQVTFMFQGGEPTLVGLDFYRSFVRLVGEHNKNRIKVHFAIQTNGYAVNDEWARFFSDNGFLVGISLDGNKDLHDLYRTDSTGHGTFSRVIKVTELFNKYSVNYNILTVVTNQLARKAEAVYNFYKKQGFRYLQFIPCLNPMGEADNIYPYTLSAERYGAFLCRVFDLWCRDLSDGTAPSIRQFDNYVIMLKGYPPESCGFSGVCSQQNVIEADGSVYPCDFYVLDELKLGNINYNSFDEINAQREKIMFIDQSKQLDDECKQCRFYPICRGGCRRYREPFSETEGFSRNCYCESYKIFFEHSLANLSRLAGHRC